jgi:hypothetical protein
MRRISRHLLFAFCFATSSAASSTSNIFARACAAPGFTQCTQAGAPSDFCCGSGTSCILLAGNTTVLCCPEGNNCAQIQPVSCDTQGQDNALHPENALKTTALTGKLATCGPDNRCCPFGYTCNVGGNCVMDADQSKAPVTSSSSSSSRTPTPTPTASSSQSSSQSTTSTTPTPTSPSQNTSTPSFVATCDKFPAPAVLVGFFPGMLLGILLTVLAICLLGARRRNQARRRSSDTSFGNIGEPQLSGGGIRTDFLRQAHLCY